MRRWGGSKEKVMEDFIQGNRWGMSGAAARTGNSRGLKKIKNV